MTGEILGYMWPQIQRAQRGGRLDDPVDTRAEGDYGYDILGKGRVRMVPSGDVLAFAEAQARLRANHGQS